MQAVSLTDRLRAARDRRFVGRRAELARFAELLAVPPDRPSEQRSDRSSDGPVAAVNLLHVHGPGGVGKTTLLHRFAELARAAGHEVVALDGRDLPGSVAAVTARLAPLLDPAPAPSGPRPVVFVDTYELLADLDDRLRTEVFPRLPADVLLILATRHRPGQAWRTDPGWAEVSEVVRLDNLAPAECAEYLERLGVTAEHRPQWIGFTHGHPLALALAGELLRRGDAAVPRASTELVQELLGRLVEEVPDAAHRAALHACAQVRVLTEPLLAAMVERPDAAALFDWLRGLPVIESGARGLYPHQLVREALTGDLQWRDPSGPARLRGRARSHYLRALAAPAPDPAPHSGAAPGGAAGTGPGVAPGGGLDRQDLLLDLMYLHQGLRAFLLPADQDGSGLRLTGLRPESRQQVRALIARHEGAASAAAADHWLDRAGYAWQLLLDAAGELVGVMAVLDLGRHPADELSADPATAAALAAVRAAGPTTDPAPDQTLYLRFWTGRDTHQIPGPEQSVIAARFTLDLLTRPGLRYSLLAVADPTLWAPLCGYADFQAWPQAGFRLGEREFAVFGHDWHRVPVAEWVTRLAAREEVEPAEVGPLADPAPAPSAEPGLWDRADFAAAVRDCLRDLHRPDRLGRNPLLGSASLLDPGRRCPPAGHAERCAALRTAVEQAARQLAASPRDAKGFRALRRTYLEPAGSQELAAEVLGLPSSTFRRHLGAGVARLTELLWDRHLHG